MLQLRSGAFVTYDGFKQSDKQKTLDIFAEHFSSVQVEVGGDIGRRCLSRVLGSSLVSHLPAILQTREISVLGWNWGQLEMDGSSMSFSINEAKSRKETALGEPDWRTAFELPLSAVTNATSASKHEASLEFAADENVPEEAQQIESMRIHFTVQPGDDELPQSRAQEFVEQVLAKADVAQFDDDAVALLEEAFFVTPRGRYDMTFYPKMLRLKGKTYVTAC